MTVHTEQVKMIGDGLLMKATTTSHEGDENTTSLHGPLQ